MPPAPQVALRDISPSKLIIGVSALAALALNQWVLLRAWWPGVLAAAILGVAAFVLARRAPRATVSLLFLLAFAAPALLAIASPTRGHALDGIWIAAALGSALGIGGLRWSLGTRWRLALGTWGLAVALSWPLIVMRETELTFALIFNHRMALSKLGVSPPDQIVWTTYVALVHLCGVLWIDAMLARYRARTVDVFEREIVTPLALGGLAGAVMALYQMVVDFGAPVGTAFAPLRRATGLMLDANTFGVAAALAGLMAALVAWPRARREMALAALAFGGIAVWGSSSRTAFALFLLGSAAFVWYATRGVPAATRRRIVVAVALVFAVALAAQALRPAFGIGGGRLLAGLGGPDASIVEIAANLWSRDGYGTLAARMIAAFPLAGIGIGSFHLFVVDFGVIELRNTLPADNAQNWLRHQLAEMGVLGTAGWIAWLCLFVPVLASRQFPTPHAARGAAVTCVLVALGLISLVGMPTQKVTLAIAFWVLVYWTVILAGKRETMERDVARPRLWWAASAIVLALFLAETGRAATGELRAPMRAQAAGWSYQRGFSQVDVSSGQPFRWTEQRAVAVVPVSAGYLPLRVHVGHPDAGQRPVDVEIWVDGRSILNERARSRQTWVRYLRIPSTRWIRLEVEVSRPFVPGQGDRRELGVAIDDWQIVTEPPPNAIVLDIFER